MPYHPLLALFHQCPLSPLLK
uniref:Protein ROOT HAIR DEFECTIVE 3-like n=1 Tax=Rhizophora mucronata TaxID=61149 RepID=A0A2P2LVR6_RHIMU